MHQPRPLQTRGAGMAPAGTAISPVRAATASTVSRAPGDPLARLTLAASASGVDPDKIFQEVLREEVRPREETSAIAAQMLALTKRAVRGRGKQPSPAPSAVPALGRVSLYNPAQDTKQNFEQARARLASSIEAMEAAGAPELHVRAYRLQREAEIDQLFPKQALRVKAEEEWKGAALLMKEKGVPSEDIRKYLKLKATLILLPTPDEIKVFIEQRKRFAAEVVQMVRGTDAPVPTAPPAGPVRGQTATKPAAPQGGMPRAMIRPVVMHKL
jgi:hypothetical protein